MRLQLFMPYFLTAMTVQASFVILARSQAQTGLEENGSTEYARDLIACPANQFNQGCYKPGRYQAIDGSGEVIEDINLPKLGYFGLSPGFCGQNRQLDFLRQNNGGYLFWIKGDKDPVGGCTVDHGSIHDSWWIPSYRAYVTSVLYCTSWVCG
jgi:hypothetical protein